LFCADIAEPDPASSELDLLLSDFIVTGQVSILVVPAIGAVQLVVVIATTPTALAVLFFLVNLRCRQGVEKRTAGCGNEQHQEAPSQIETIAETAQNQKCVELALHTAPIISTRPPMCHPA
jgi:hypothetical protein